jgi:hypothetical protein
MLGQLGVNHQPCHQLVTSVMHLCGLRFNEPVLTAREYN